MDIKRVGSTPSAKGPSDWFTGTVRIDALFQAPNPAFVQGASVTFEFVSTLRMFGYDYVLSIEHEDSLLSAEEGLSRAAAFLNGIVPGEKPGAAWWV